MASIFQAIWLFGYENVPTLIVPTTDGPHGYNKKDFHEGGITTEFVQDSHCSHTYGSIQGLRAQSGESARAELLQVICGEVVYVIVDIRTTSETFGKYFSAKLSEENGYQLYVPQGFLHGFVVLSKQAQLFCKADKEFNHESEIHLRHDDPNVNVNWRIPPEDVKVSAEGMSWPDLLIALREPARLKFP